MEDISKLRDMVGRVVRGVDGEKLGRVVQCDEASFVCEKGIFFPRDFVIRYEDVDSITEDEVLLRRPGIDYLGEPTPVRGSPFAGLHHDEGQTYDSTQQGTPSDKAPGPYPPEQRADELERGRPVEAEEPRPHHPFGDDPEEET